MMSLETIQEMNREAAAQNARLNRRPLLMEDFDWTDAAAKIQTGIAPNFGFPHMAPEYVDEYYPNEFEVVDTLFCDKGGFSLFDAGGPALSINAMVQKGIALTTEHGALFWTIHDEGQFQIYISAYRRVDG